MKKWVGLFPRVGAAALSGALAGWSLSHFFKPPNRSDSVGDGQYSYDSPLGPSLPIDACLRQGERLAVLVGLGNGSQVPEYLGVLHRHYGSNGLRVLVVLPQNGPDALTSAAAIADVPSVVDRDGAFQRLLRFSAAHGHGAILIYGPNYKVKFHSLTMPDNDLLRQLVEKYLLGKIDYEPMRILASSLSGRKVEGLRCGSEGRFDSSNRILVVFPPGCSSCELNNYKESLGQARKVLARSVQSHERWMLVFLGGRDSESLALAKSLNFKPKDVCAAWEPLLFDPYQTRSSSGNREPILLATGDEGKITRVFGLSELAKEGAR